MHGTVHDDAARALVPETAAGMAPVSATVVGGPAVPFALADASALCTWLDDYRGGWLLLVFHRHLGCPPCRGHRTICANTNRDFAIPTSR